MRRVRWSPRPGTVNATLTCAYRMDECAHIDSGLWVPIQLHQLRAKTIAWIRIYALRVYTVRLNRPCWLTVLGCAQALVGSEARCGISTTFGMYHNIPIREEFIGSISYRMLKLPFSRNWLLGRVFSTCRQLCHYCGH
jgi:hypothetical protein